MAAATVLVVDDDKSVLDFATQALGAAGYAVLGATTGRRALEIVNGGNRVDLVVSDVVMPEMRGPQLVREIRQVSPKTAVMLMSGYLADPAEMPAEVPFLAKPFSPRDLVAAVERTLAKCSQAREDLKVARAQARQLRDERRRFCEELRETARRSQDLIRDAQEQLKRGSKKR